MNDRKQNRQVERNSEMTKTKTFKIFQYRELGKLVVWMKQAQDDILIFKNKSMIPNCRIKVRKSSAETNRIKRKGNQNIKEKIKI